MSYSKQMASMLTTYFDDNNITYEFNADKGIFQMGFSLTCKLKSEKTFIFIDENFYTVYVVIPMSADEECRPNVAEFITRANYGLRNGNFEMDFNDGEIRYKTFVCFKDCLLSNYMIERSLNDPDSILERYGNGLLAVMFGYKTPKDAIDEIEN